MLFNQVDLQGRWLTVSQRNAANKVPLPIYNLLVVLWAYSYFGDGHPNEHGNTGFTLLTG
jgi:hypothetical protein